MCNPFENTHDLVPNHEDPCIYFLIHRHHVVYIGQTKKHFKNRILEHLQDKQFDAVSWKIYNNKPTTLNHWESHWIARFNPKYNKRMPSNDFHLSIFQILERCDITPEELNSKINQTKTTPSCIVAGNPYYHLPSLNLEVINHA